MRKKYVRPKAKKKSNLRKIVFGAVHKGCLSSAAKSKKS